MCSYVSGAIRKVAQLLEAIFYEKYNLKRTYICVPYKTLWAPVAQAV
jgi:hypothetical protein